MEKKIVNTDDHDVLNRLSDAHNDGAVTEAQINPAPVDQTEKAVDDNNLVGEDKPLPDEIAFPHEQENADEMA